MATLSLLPVCPCARVSVWFRNGHVGWWKAMDWEQETHREQEYTLAMVFVTLEQST